MTRTEMEHRRSELLLEKAQLVQRKAELSMEINEVNTMLLRTHPHTKFIAFQEKRKKLTKSVLEIDRRFQFLKLEINKLNLEITSAEKEVNAPREQTLEWKRSVVDQLVAIRSDYQAFAADHSRISSRRAMAAEFVVKLNSVIKTAMNREA